MVIRSFDREKCTGCGTCIACWGCESFCPQGCFDVSPERGRGELVSPY